MTMDVRTMEGDYFEAGFWGADTTQIMLGDLPAMNIEEFGAYARSAILAIVQQLTPEEHRMVEPLITQTSELLAGVQVRTVPSPYSGHEDPAAVTHEFMRPQDELHSALAAEGVAKVICQAQGHSKMHYSNNPFITREATVIIGGRHEVSHMEFLVFALNYFEGGTFGWHEELGAPKVIHDAMRDIREAYEAVNY